MLRKADRHGLVASSRVALRPHRMSFGCGLRRLDSDEHMMTMVALGGERSRTEEGCSVGSVAINNGPKIEYMLS